MPIAWIGLVAPPTSPDWLVVPNPTLRLSDPELWCPCLTRGIRDPGSLEPGALSAPSRRLGQEGTAQMAGRGPGEIITAVGFGGPGRCSAL